MYFQESFANKPFATILTSAIVDFFHITYFHMFIFLEDFRLKHLQQDYRGKKVNCVLSFMNNNRIVTEEAKISFLFIFCRGLDK